MLFFVLLLSGSTFSSATVSPSAIKCLNGFIGAYKAAKGYSTKIKKTEFEFGSPLTENIEIVEKGPNEVSVKFSDPGESGVRNNGMVVSYKGGTKVHIEFGKSAGFGLFKNALAEAFVKKDRELYDGKVIEKQIFTVDRSGFGFLARTLDKKMNQLKAGELGEFSVDEGTCRLRFKAKSVFAEVEWGPGQSVQELEEEYGNSGLPGVQRKPKAILFLQQISEAKKEDHDSNIAVLFGLSARFG